MGSGPLLAPEDKFMSVWTRLVAALLPLMLAAAVCLLPEASAQERYIKSGDGRDTEFWEGKILTAKFRAGMCFEPDGKARGVLILTHHTGREDTYHLYGTKLGDKFDLSHSSGHYFKGTLKSPGEMEGNVKLSNGMKMSLKGSRKQNVTLKAPDCAPLF